MLLIWIVSVIYTIYFRTRNVQPLVSIRSCIQLIDYVCQFNAALCSCVQCFCPLKHSFLISLYYYHQKCDSSSIISRSTAKQEVVHEILALIMWKFHLHSAYFRFLDVRDLFKYRMYVGPPLSLGLWIWRENKLIDAEPFRIQYRALMSEYQFCSSP